MQVMPTDQASTPDPQPYQNANVELKTVIEDIIINDERFVGMSRYVYDINFYWRTDISTACAGYGFIFINPDFWSRLDLEQQKTVLAHEIWHLMLKHLERTGDKNPSIANQAEDHVINLGLKADGFKMDEGMDFGGIEPCCDPRFEGMGSNAVYSILYGEQQQQPPSPNMGTMTPTKEEIEQMIQDAMQDMGMGSDVQAQKDANEQKVDNVMAGINPGSETGGTAMILQAFNTAVVIQGKTYDEIFSKYLIDPLSGGKRTYIRPSRRPSTNGMRLKGRTQHRGNKNRLTKLCYALDVSGSVTKEERQMFASSAKTLKEMLNPEEMIIILWDNIIQYEERFTEHEELDNIPHLGGGGTKLGPVYARVREHNPEALVIFTDLQVSIPPQPSWDTIWFVSSTKIHSSFLQVPYGNIYLIPEK